MADMTQKQEPFKLLISILEQRQGSELARLYSRQGVSWHYQSTGLGTASSELLSVLGFGTKERDLLISFAPKRRVERLMYLMNDELRTVTSARGILFDLPVTGINYLFTYVYSMAEKAARETAWPGEMAQEESELTENRLNRGEELIMPHQKTNSLILVTMNQGHTDAVMDTARKAGARGGTILRARFLGTQESSHIFGITLQAEKEIAAILVPNQSRNAVMEAVGRNHGAGSEAGAVICSLPVDHVVRLT